MGNIPLEKRLSEILMKRVKDLIDDYRLFRLKYNNKEWYIIYFNHIVVDYHIAPKVYGSYILTSNSYFELLNRLYGIENINIQEIIPTTRWA